MTEMSRRLMLSMIAGAIALPRSVNAIPAQPAARRRLRLVNVHTGEKFDGSYRDDAGPVASAMADLAVFLRDFHAAATIAIDVAVIDFLAAVMDAVGAQSASILSAYRTPETNAKLAHTTFGVAENSYHLYGRALDIHFGTRLSDAMGAARAMGRGGVGWYPHSGFLHIDTGPVRNWNIDESGLDALLFSRRRPRHNNSDASNDRYTPEFRRSGLPQPGLEHRSRLRSELEHSGRLLPKLARRHPLR